MGDLLIANQIQPVTPASGWSDVYVDSTTKKLAQVDDAAHVYGVLSRNQYTGASFTSVAADTYLTGSGLLIPSSGLQVGDMAQWIVHVSKTNVGTTACVVTLRSGANQSTADTSILAQTQSVAQAAAVGDGQLLVTAYCTAVGASGIMAMAFGFTSAGTGVAFGTGKSSQSGTFNTNTVTAPGLYLGISVNAQTGATWTFTGVWSSLTG